jgi:DNA-binding HxlR family transcriptional regulator
VSSKTISHRLKSLEEKGLINRTVFDEKPVRIEYSLTEKGQALNQIIHQMSQYGEEYLRK